MSADLEITYTAEAEQLGRRLADIEKLCVEVGFHAGEHNYSEVGEDSIDVAQIAAINEFGTETIPARPFMHNAVQKGQDKVAQMMASEMQQIMQGKSVDQALLTVGALMKALIQEEITFGDFAPNAPSTIKAKGSSHPLIDTGLMRQSVHEVVKEKR